jgi:hypothetical protein
MMWQIINADDHTQTLPHPQSGKRVMRNPFLITWFAIALWLKLGINKYEFMRQCLYLPSVRTLSDYASPCINDPNGVLFTVLAHE